MGPLVSVVFTSYNHVEYLEQALNSIIQQTYRNIELIIVDDCSTDGSQDILRKYAAYPQVQLHLLEKNTGSYVKSSNYGARMAKGEYLLFAQCDDFCAPDQVEKLLAPFSVFPKVGVVFSRSTLIDADGEVLGDDFVVREKDFREKCATDTLISGKEMRDFLSFSCVIPNLSAAMLKRSLYVQLNGLSDSYRMAADWAFWLSLSEYTDFYYLTEPLNNFRQHATTIRSKVKIATQIMEIYTIFYEHIAAFKLKGKEKQKMKSGAGAIWFWYFMDSPKAWWQSFPSLLTKTFSIEKLNLLYLSSGFIRHLKERIKR